MAKSGLFFRKGVVFCHTFFVVKYFFVNLHTYKVNGHLIVFTDKANTYKRRTSRKRSNYTKKAWGGVSRWWLSYSFHYEMGHFCKRLLLCTKPTVMP